MAKNNRFSIPRSRNRPSPTTLDSLHLFRRRKLPEQKLSRVTDAKVTAPLAREHGQHSPVHRRVQPELVQQLRHHLELELSRPAALAAPGHAFSSRRPVGGGGGGLLVAQPEGPPARGVPEDLWYESIETF